MRIRLAVLAVIALCLTPFLMAQILAAHKEREESLGWVEQSMRGSVDHVRDFLESVQSDVENISANISISNAYQNTSAESCHERLRKVAGLYDDVSHVSILTPGGIVYCSSNATAHGIQATGSEKLAGSPHDGDTYWGETQLSRITDKLVIPSATAIRNDLDTDYLIVASISAEAVLKRVLDLFDVSLKEAVIIDPEGGILASKQFSSPETIISPDLIGRSLGVSSGVIPESVSDKTSYYAGVVKFPMNNSRFIFLAPLKEEYDRARAKLKMAIIMAIVETLILASITMFFVEFFFIRNLRRIGALASEITAGNQGRRISIKSPLADFNALVAALNLMVDKLEDTSLHDALTSVANRRALDGHLALCDRLLAEGKGSFAVAMIDIDNFKLFNDRFGHASGDRALQGVGQVLKKYAKRQSEMAARYGGEEFTLVVNEDDPERLRAHLDAFRQSVEELDIPHPDSPHGRLTVSVGYAVASPGTTMQQAMERADEALYRAKEGGRNRIDGDGMAEA